MAEKSISFILNGRPVNCKVQPDTLLVDLLRETLGLSGTKVGCGKGECGSCTVLLDNVSVNSCLVLAAEVSGKQVVTIEGLGTENDLSVLQRAFIEEGAVQCGFCTPGMSVSAEALLRSNSQPSDEDIREAMSGNICRCTGYSKIIKAVKKALEQKEGVS
jgi:aerobic carbon-monoxide dehydrogenase small subunit